MEPITSTAPRTVDRAVFGQQWLDLAFLHWPIDPALVAPRLPRGTVPDVHDGKGRRRVLLRSLEASRLLVSWLRGRATTCRTCGPHFPTARWGLFSSWYGDQTVWAPVKHEL